MKYIDGHKKSGIKVEDKVKILRKAKSYEGGWNNNWAVEMDAAVGKTGRVVEDGEKGGFFVRISAVRCGGVVIELAYPYFVLEKIVKAKKK